MKFIPRLLLVFAGLWLVTVPVAGTAGGGSLADRISGVFGGGASDDILHPDRAFELEVDTSNPARLVFRWDIAEGYYLYRDKFRVTASSDTVAVADLNIPPGTIESDPVFGDVAVFYDQVEITTALSRAAAEPGDLELQVGYQGCKKGSVCYPPQTQTFPMNLAPVQAAAAAPAAASPSADHVPQSTQDRITSRLADGGLLLNLVAFFGFGLLLSLTPCVFPMIPILSGIIVGQGRQVTAVYGFLLSLAYVLAMALTYAVLGVIAGSFNINLQAASQNAWAIGAFSGVFVLLALSMFGFYELQLPSALQAKLHGFSNRQRSGSLWGAALMGVISAIIVGPCVAPPLAGALLYISQTGNALLGGTALFAMGLGFGVPLLIIGGSAGGLLPTADEWMDTIKRIFGVVMLGVAIWFLERIVPAAVSLMLWAGLLIVTAVYMGALDSFAAEARWRRLWKGIGLVFLVYGVILIIAAVTGGKDPLRPLADSKLLSATPVSQQAGGELHFERVKTVADVREAVLQASLEERMVMLDFYADWCVVCQELEEYTLRDPAVHEALEDFVLLKADVTANDAEDRELLQKYELFGPPAILFFGTDAREKRPYRLVGFINADGFVDHINRVTEQ
ncbi:MAG: protein-disulfide reductase DsbD [Gammaproteobacteria bacterium]|nr:protein-disulfide reductase DsbD [Gammaproteobacteria bacterium]